MHGSGCYDSRAARRVSKPAPDFNAPLFNTLNAGYTDDIIQVKKFGAFVDMPMCGVYKPGRQPSPFDKVNFASAATSWGDSFTA